MRKPSMKQAEWIAKRLEDWSGTSADDVFDVLTGQITTPVDLVSEVLSLAQDYEDNIRQWTR